MQLTVSLWYFIFGIQLFSESAENGGHGWSRRRRGHPFHPAVLPKVEQPSGWFFSVLWNSNDLLGVCSDLGKVSFPVPSPNSEPDPGHFADFKNKIFYKIGNLKGRLGIFFNLKMLRNRIKPYMGLKISLKIKKYTIF